MKARQVEGQGFVRKGALVKGIESHHFRDVSAPVSRVV